MMNTIAIGNPHLHSAIDSILEQIDRDQKVFDYIIGLSRGGIVPAGYMSYRLGVPVTCLNFPTHFPLNLLYDLAQKNVLIIDNIATTGSSLQKVKDDILALREADVFVGDVATCSLFGRSAAIGNVGYVGILLGNNRRCVFPWEQIYTGTEYEDEI